MNEIIGNVVIESRGGHDEEMKEMRNFVAELQKSSSDQNVERVFYDSKSACCSIHFSIHEDDIDPAEKNLIFFAAKEHISQFDWDGSVYHGKPLTGP